MKDIEDEIPFEVPEGWAWCRLPELCTTPIIDGTHQTPTYSDKENGIPFLSSKDVTSGKIEWSKIKYITKSLHEELYKRVAPQINDILLAKNGTTGIAAIVEDDIIFDIYVTLAVIRPNINLCNPHFLLNLVNSDFCKSQFNSHLTGIGVPNLHLVDIKKTLIPLPPLEEQKEINDTLKVFLDKIEILNINKGELQTAIKHAKSKILDLAIHGKLVPQNPSEEPAGKLLEKIRAEKEAKIAAGELKRDKNDSYIYKNPSDNCHYRKYIDGHEEYAEDEFYRNIPVNWCLCNLGELCLEIKRGKSPKYTDKSNYLVFAQKCNQKYGPTSLEKALYLDESTLKKYPPSEFMQFDDIVINSTGTGTMGRVGIFKNTIPYDIKGIVPDSHVTVIRTMRNIDQNYIYAFLKLNQGKLEGFGEGSTNQKELRPLTISELITPLPPAEEQKRIVSKIEEIFGILDTISKNLE